MVALLEALTAPNVDMNSIATGPGPNTSVDARFEPDNWVPWHDFDYATLTRIFRTQLGQPYRGERQPRPLPNDLAIFNEESFDDLLRRFVSPVVNYALEDQTGSCHYGRGTRCGAGYKPDWSVVSSLCFDRDSGGPLNVLPGDTKLDSKWRPEMVDDPAKYEEWQKVVTQIVNYMAYHSSRYGFIITDTVLVALRITRREVGTGLAANRPRRAVITSTAAHQRLPSDTSMMSGASTYYDDDPMQWDYHDPEYAVVPWAAHGRGVLTVKLALWCLAMMAGNGQSSIDYQYPHLDSWRVRAGRKGYVHNTSGATKGQLSSNDRYQEQLGVGGSGPSGGQQLDEAAAAWEGSEQRAEWGLAGPSTSQDALHFSQPGSPLVGGEVEDEIDWGGAGSEGAEDEGADHEGGEREHGDDQTEVGYAVKRITVTVKKHRFTKKLFFVDAKGNQRDTSKDKWRKVAGGYELGGRKHVYFTKQFP